MGHITHEGARLLHLACISALQRLDLVNDGLAMPIGGATGGTEIEHLDELEEAAWSASASLLGVRDDPALTIGGHQAAIEAHRDRETFDAEAAEIALDDKCDWWPK